MRGSIEKLFMDKKRADALVKEQIRNFPYHTAYGMEMMKGGMIWLNNMLVRCRKIDGGAKYITCDYSSFDTTIPAWMIRDVFSVIEEILDFSHDSDGHQLEPNKEKGKFRKMINYFINTPIRNMDGRRFLKDHGVPSGSMFTNIIDTFVNMVVMMTILLIVCGDYPLFITAFGDDSVCAMSGKSIINMDALARAADYLFGMKINVNKSYWTHQVNNVHYLGYFNMSGGQVKPTEELVASMLFPQYLQDDWSYCVSRALGCCLAAAGNSPDVFQLEWYTYQLEDTLERWNRE